MFRAFPLRVVLQTGVNHSLIGGAARDALTRDSEDVFYVRIVAHDVADLLHDPARVLHRSARRRLDRYDEPTLVLAGHKSLRDTLENEVTETEANQKKYERHQPVAQEYS